MEIGIFASVNDAIGFVRNAHERYQTLSLEDRCEIIEAIRCKLLEQVDVIAMLALQETGMGNYADKKTKLEAAIKNTPGVEDLITEVKTGDRGMVLYELSGFGVICTLEPVTSPAASLVNHVISMVAAGNAVVICPNPRALQTTKYVTSLISSAIVETCGIDNLVVALDESSIDKAQEIMHHPDVDMIVCNAGEAALKGALSCGKKVIGEGQSNAVVLVDETADLNAAAFEISRSASFDNNLIHTSEKTIVVVKEAKDELVKAFARNKTKVISSSEECQKLADLILRQDMVLRRKWIGKSAAEILDAAGISHESDVQLILVEADLPHPFVTEELRTPVLAYVVAENYEEGLEMTLDIEQRYKHTAAIFSKDINRLSEAARVLQTAVFVKNGPSLSGVGLLAPNSPFALTVANVTGEGAVTARHFARRRKCILTNGFSIR